MHWTIPVLCFFAGAMFGLQIMALFAVSGREDREEVIRNAGGSGEQGCEPCDQHDQDECTDNSLSGPGLSESSEECKSKEGA